MTWRATAARPYSAASLERKLKALNGVLLPGGDSDISPGTALYGTAARIVQLAMEAGGV